MCVNTRYKHSTNTVGVDVVWGNEDVPLMDFIYLVFTHMPGQSYCGQLRSSLLHLRYVFWVLINSPGCYFWRVEHTVSHLAPGRRYGKSTLQQSRQPQKLTFSVCCTCVDRLSAESGCQTHRYPQKHHITAGWYTLLPHKRKSTCGFSQAHRYHPDLN